MVAQTECPLTTGMLIITLRIYLPVITFLRYCHGARVAGCVSVPEHTCGVTTRCGDDDDDDGGDHDDRNDRPTVEAPGSAHAYMLIGTGTVCSLTIARRPAATGENTCRTTVQRICSEFKMRLVLHLSWPRLICVLQLVSDLCEDYDALNI